MTLEEPISLSALQVYSPKFSLYLPLPLAPKNQSSEYVAEYQRKQAAFEMSQKDKLNLRASHFEFGPHDPSKTFVTLHQKDYKTHVGFQAPKLNEEKKRDLRSSHFVLGKLTLKCE